MSVKRGRTKYNRAETKQSRAEHSHPVVGWFSGLAPEHLCHLGSQPVRGGYTNLIYMCRTSHQLSSLTCPSAPSPRGPLASADRTRLVSSAVQICRCFNVSPHSTYAIDCPMLKRINNLSWLQKIRIIGCPNEQVLKGVPSLDSMR